MIRTVFVRPPNADGTPLTPVQRLTNPSLVGFVFALLPAGAMALGLALQAALAVEVGLDDVQIANLGLMGAVGAAGGSVLGGLVSDKTGHRRTLAVYVMLTLLPTAYLAWAMHTHGWIDPVLADVDTRVAPPALVDAFWYATLSYGFFSGLTYGTRMAIFMSLCTKEVAATQFTLYMAAQNTAITYAAAWQGYSVEAWGYPSTLGVDCLLGLTGLALLPLLVPVPGPAAGDPSAAPQVAA
jgi:PAT family beta-lactamase induction signal transducer AmpG